MSDVRCYRYSGNNNANNVIPLDQLYQWDRNIIMVVRGLDEITSNVKVHFTNRLCEKAIVVVPPASDIDTTNNIIRVRIPNDLLKTPETIEAYIFDAKSGGTGTTYRIKLPVISRKEGGSIYINDQSEIPDSNFEVETLTVRQDITASGDITAKRIRATQDLVASGNIFINENEPVATEEYVGSMIQEMLSKVLAQKGILSSGSVLDVQGNCFYLLSGGNTYTDLPEWIPYSTSSDRAKAAGYLMSVTYTTNQLLVYFSKEYGIMVRAKTAGEWGDWKYGIDSEFKRSGAYPDAKRLGEILFNETLVIKGVLPTNTAVTDAGHGVWLLSGNSTYSGLPSWIPYTTDANKTNAAGYLMSVIHTTNQFLIYYSKNYGIMVRFKTAGEWGDWKYGIDTAFERSGASPDAKRIGDILFGSDDHTGKTPKIQTYWDYNVLGNPTFSIYDMPKRSFTHCLASAFANKPDTIADTSPVFVFRQGGNNSGNVGYAYCIDRTTSYIYYTLTNETTQAIYWHRIAYSENAIESSKVAAITAENKSEYFTDADNAPNNSIFRIMNTAEIENTPYGNGYSTSTGTYNGTVRSVAGYISGTLLTYGASEPYRNQIFISGNDYSSNSAKTSVMYFRSRFGTDYGWSEWHLLSDRGAITGSNVIIRKKLIAQYQDATGAPTATNTGIINQQRIKGDPFYFSDFNDAPLNSIVQIDPDCDSTVMRNNPLSGQSCVLMTWCWSYVRRQAVVQFCVGLSSEGGTQSEFCYRYGYINASSKLTWTNWENARATTDTTLKKAGRAADAFAVGAMFKKAPVINGILPTDSDLTAITETGIWVLGGDNTYVGLPNWIPYETSSDKTKAAGYLMSVCFSTSQMLVYYSKNYGTILRFKTLGTWGDWYCGIDTSLQRSGAAADAKTVGGLFDRTRIGRTVADGTNANDITENGVYFSVVNSENPNGTILNLPYKDNGWLEVIRWQNSSTPVLQVFYPYYGTNDHTPKKRFRKYNQEWTDWYDFIQVDTSLEKSGAAADAATVGALFKKTAVINGILPHNSDLTAITETGIWLLGGDNTYFGMPEWIPYETSSDRTKAAGYLMSVCFSTSQMLVYYSKSYGTILRFKTLGTWGSWYCGVDASFQRSGAAADAATVGAMFDSTRLTGKSYTYGTSANDLIENGIYFSSTTTDYPDGTITNLPFVGTSGWLEVTRQTKQSNIVLQVFYPYYGSNDRVPKRRFRKANLEWTEWLDFTQVDTSLKKSGVAADAAVVGGFFDRVRIGRTVTVGTSADDLVDNGIYYSIVNSANPNGTIIGLPDNDGGWLEVTHWKDESTPVLQVFYPYYGTQDKSPKRRFRKYNQEWTPWFDFGKSSMDVTNNYSYEITENTYTVTASPTISTGIPYVLTSTGDSTDRAADIAAVLTTNGACVLGTGTFYISNLSIGPNQSLRGSGIGNTTVRMIDTATGNAISLGSRSSVSDLTIYGGESTMATSNGGRNGIGWQGTYISPDNTGNSIYRGQLSNIQIFGFSGAGILCSNTSTNIATGLNAVNINIYRCWAGIYIPIYSEYHRFTNIEVDGCYYGVINNGGNNMFSNCGFNANQIGFYIDNSSSQSPNNSHGSAVGCTFNHSGDSSGTAIKLDGVSAGYVFSACQVFYGKLDIKNSCGVNFASCNIGINVPILINGGGVVAFSNTMFRSSPAVTKTNAPIIKSIGCYIRDTGADVVI